MLLQMSVSNILAHRLQNYQNFIEMTSNMIYIVELGGGLKCPRKNPFEHPVLNCIEYLVSITLPVV